MFLLFIVFCLLCFFIPSVRAQASTPISVKSGISHRLSPLLQKERTFATFRGESPSSFKFDSDSDTLTKNSQRSKVNPMPSFSSSSRRDVPRFEPNAVSAFSGPAGHIGESDTENELVPRSRLPSQPSHVDSIFSPGTSAGGYSSREPGPSRAGHSSTFIPPPTNPRRDSEPDYSDGGSNPSGSLTRRTHIPRLPLYPGIEFTHHAFGLPNRNSLSAFSNNSFALNNENYSQGGLEPYHVSANRLGNSGVGNFDVYHETPRNTLPNTAVTRNTGNLTNDLQEPRPVSVEEDFLLPPYPEVDEDEDDTLSFHVGYTTFSPQNDAERVLVSKSRSESLA